MMIIKQLLYEHGRLSQTRLVAASGWLIFLAASVYMLTVGREWSHYETFSLYTAGGGAITQLANKLINSKYNSAAGEHPVKNG